MLIILETEFLIKDRAEGLIMNVSWNVFLVKMIDSL